MTSGNLVDTTKTYYDSQDADEFYYNVWGGEDIHVGIYTQPGEDIFKASRRTVQKLASKLTLDASAKILDIGAGYGGAARFLAAKWGCHVACLNLSEKENERNEEKNKEAVLSHLIDVQQGNFEEIPYPDAQFDVVWCQDAILHSGNKEQVFREVNRVLKPGGQFIFTDPMQDDVCPEGVLDPILQRIHLKEMGSVKMYREYAEAVGLEVVEIEEMPEQLINHYRRVREELMNRKEELLKVCDEGYLNRMQLGLTHWVEGGKNRYLNWGILHFRKPGS